MNPFKFKVITLITLSTLFIIYSANLYLDKIPEQSVANMQAQRGKIIFQEKNCISCHQIYGLGGHLGPDITNVYAHRNEAYIKAFLSSGTLVMPDFHLTDTEMNDLIEYLKYINTTGNADPRSFIKHSDGTIKQ